MGKSLEPKCKQCRRAGEKLMLKGARCLTPKCAMVKRNYIPGFHGPKRKGMARKSEYGMQLNEKQKAKRQYGLLEKQFKLTYDKAAKRGGDTGENLFILLEERLDNVIYRLGFASSRREARQSVGHYHFTVNGKKINIPSCQLREGDVIELNKKSKSNKNFRELAEKIKNIEVPGWLNLDKKELKAKVLHEPTFKQISVNINTPMIVEFYSK